MIKRTAFTMLELVMVIVVMGIVASIGADIIVNLYENYVKSRAINKLQAQSELILDQIAKRLQYRVRDSVIARNNNTFLDYVPLTDANDSYQILEWIGKDNEGFVGNGNPGWSGFVDLESNETDKTLGTHGKLKTLGSELNTTNDIIKALSYDTVSLDVTYPDKPAIIFKGQTTFDLAEYGWDGTDGNYTFRVSYTAGANDVLNFEETPPTEIFEQYDLAWSAYAIVPEGNNIDDFNLTLKYNYQPWEDEKYDDANTTNIKKAVLAEHVSTFKFTQIGDTIRLKLCLNDSFVSANFNFAFCKERVVY